MTKFLGREAELSRLNELTMKPSASLVVVKGRRRIGKSRLLQEFGRQFDRACTFSGLPPDEATSAQSQRDEFAKQLQQQLGLRGISRDNWSDLLWHLAQQTQEGRVLIVLDEITWMGDKDPLFLGQLKNTWDLYFSQNPQLILALSGSLSMWIESNILSSTGFFGRQSLTLNLGELPLNVCKQFWYSEGVKASPYEMLKVLTVTGGVPRYLEEVNPKRSAEDNIRKLAFVEGEILVNEFEKIFSDLFSSRNELYKKMVTLLASGSKTQGEIADALGYRTQGEISNYLEELEQSGFISRDFTWNIGKAQHSNLSTYRLSDNYSRFYLKYILPNRNKIARGVYEEISMTSLPAWSAMMGLQVENLVLSHHKMIKKKLQIPLEEVDMDGAFFQRKTQRQQGCQIDYLIQTRGHTLYVCEVKFSRNPVGMNVVNEVEEKITRLKTPKQYFCRPVLIHVNGVTDDVIDSQYFDHIIDLAELFDD